MKIKNKTQQYNDKKEKYVIIDPKNELPQTEQDLRKIINKLKLGDKIQVTHTGDIFIGCVTFIDNINIHKENSQIWIEEATIIANNKKNATYGCAHLWIEQISEIKILK